MSDGGHCFQKKVHPSFTKLAKIHTGKIKEQFALNKVDALDK